RNLGPLRDRLREPKKKGTGLPTIDVDLSSSRCFPVPNGLSVGGIRLNLMGREPTGALDPVDADQFCEDLSNDLLAIREPGTDRALVKAVRRTSDLYSGRYLDHLPDLLVEWDDTVPVGSAGLGTGAGSVIRACSEKIGTVEGQNEYGRSGEHRPDGFFVAAGPRITQGRLERRVGLIDLAPTLCHRLGVALPGCTGARIPELLGP
ncbi:MAG: hypothetical protein KJN92_15570, partial [Gemmatimonadetes bacterium]|nr:hypothetical protein [Gemmatimonadota bacterium]